MLRLRAAALGPPGRALFENLDLQLEAGERLVVFGASGAGKTTLLTALYGVAGAAAALIPQPHGLVAPLSVAQNLALGTIEQRPLWKNLRSLIHMPARERAAVRSWAEKVDLQDKLDQPVATLSGGEQSRTAIGRALYRGGELLLADEPCAALDPERARRALQALQGRFPTMVLTMHDVRAGLELATRVIGIAQGQICFDRHPGEFGDAELQTLYGSSADPGNADAPALPTAAMAPRGCM